MGTGKTGNWGSGQITHPAGDDGNTLPARCEGTGEFVMAGPSGFVKRSKGLMDE
jgi:hypothetical protein